MWFLVLGSLFLSLAANASLSIKAKIHDIDYGTGDEEAFLLLTSGDVAWLGKQKKSRSGFLELARHSNKTMMFHLNDKHELLSFEALPSTPRETPENFISQTTNENYTPTVFENLEAAQAMFRTARYVSKESQCYNRAHIWSYEWYTKHQVLSNKSWIFFTRRYIRKYKFDWWFHVAPSVAVKEGEVIREKVMDVKYSRGPIDIKRWTDYFMLDDANCPFVKTYSDYANYPESGSCYTMKTSMFYYQPLDIEIEENSGKVRDDWYYDDLEKAYLEAFDEVITINEGI